MTLDQAREWLRKCGEESRSDVEYTAAEETVLDLERRGPHAQGPAECLRCGRCWVAVWPVGVVEPLHLECPTCGSPTPKPTRTMEGR